jgi:hypothetical protein
MSYTLKEAQGIDLTVNGLDLEISVAPNEIAEEILTALKTVDGSGSGLDADFLDGLTSSFLLSRTNHTGTQAVSTLSDYTTATDTRIDNRVTKSFVDALGINATQLNGQAGTHYLARANHTGTQLASTISDFATQANALTDARVTKSFVDALGINATQLGGQAGSHYLARANHTGTQLASTISDFNTAVDARVSSGITSQVTANFVSNLNVDADTIDNLDSADLLKRANHTGTQAVSTLSDYATATDGRIDARVTKTFVDNLGVNAATLGTQNGAHYLARANHTGTQTAATISDFTTQVNSKIDTRVTKSFVDALGVNSATLGGQNSAYHLARGNHTGTQAATTVTYDNTGHDLIATNVQAAIDELDFKKVDIESLSSNIIFYSTTASAGIGPYNKLVTSIADPSFDTTAVNVSTGSITGQDQLVAGFISAAGVLVGNPGVFSVTTVGNLRRTAGNDTAEFYFKVFQRDAAGNEAEIGVSGKTPAVSSATYIQFAEYALINNGNFIETDRIVIKYFASRIGGSQAPTYDIQVGGTNPVRTLFPVPISVIPPEVASNIIVDTSTFNVHLTSGDDTVQKALNRLDDHGHVVSQISDFSTGVGTVVTKSFVEALNVEIAALKATGAATGYVLTANGTGGATWQSALANVNLTDLNDVNYSFGPPVQGDQLIYNETTGTWQPQTPVGSGDMLKSTYDQNLNNIVDKAESLDDGTYAVSAQVVKQLVDSDPIGQAVALAIALG